MIVNGETLGFGYDGSPSCKIAANASMTPNSFEYTYDGAAWFTVISVVPTTGHIKTINGVAWEHIKSYNGVDQSHIKTAIGVEG